MKLYGYSGVLLALLSLDSSPAMGATAEGPQHLAWIDQSFGRMPLYFVENRGQLDARVAYYVLRQSTAVHFTPQGMTFALTMPADEPARHGPLPSLYAMARRALVGELLTTEVSA